MLLGKSCSRCPFTSVALFSIFASLYDEAGATCFVHHCGQPCSSSAHPGRSFSVRQGSLLAQAHLRSSGGDQGPVSKARYHAGVRFAAVAPPPLVLERCVLLVELPPGTPFRIATWLPSSWSALIESSPFLRDFDARYQGVAFLHGVSVSTVPCARSAVQHTMVALCADWKHTLLTEPHVPFVDFGVVCCRVVWCRVVSCGVVSCLVLSFFFPICLPACLRGCRLTLSYRCLSVCLPVYAFRQTR